MSDYVCKIEETMDQLVDQKISECRLSQTMAKMDMIRKVSHGDVCAIMNLRYMMEAEKELGNYADRAIKVSEELIHTSGDFVKAFFVDVCAERERYLSDRTDRQLRERLRDGELFEILKNMSKIIGMKSLFGISTREEYLEWIEGERELDFHCV